MEKTNNGWQPIMIKSDLKVKLQELMKEMGISSMSKAIEYLLEKNNSTNYGN